MDFFLFYYYLKSKRCQNDSQSKGKIYSPFYSYCPKSAWDIFLIIIDRAVNSFSFTEQTFV